VLPEPLKGHPEEPFFRNVSERTTSSGKILEEVFRELSGRPVLPKYVLLLPEYPLFRKSSGRPSSGSSGRTPNGSSGRRHRHQAFAIFFDVLYPKVQLTCHKCDKYSA